MSGPLRIGLTGGIGSGKTTACNLFKGMGVPVIDADQVTRDLTSPGKPALDAIARTFGRELIKDDGGLDRDRMRKIIFNDADARRKLESILHPLVYAEIERLTGEVDADYCIVSIPLLLETGNADQFDRVLVIDVPEDIQRERATRRDNTDPMEIQSIIDSQISRSERLKLADDIVRNNGDIASLEKQINQIHEKYTELAENMNKNRAE